MEIQNVRSPGGVEAWLVEDRMVPMLAMRFAFEGGSSQDPAGKEGLAHFVTGMLDQEGGDDLRSIAYQQRIEDLVIRVGFRTGKDYFGGSLETLTETRHEAAQLLMPALNLPRFYPDAEERIRHRIFGVIAGGARDPFTIASAHWDELAFAGHPYAQPVLGTKATVSKIGLADLETYCRRVFAKNTLKVVAVGDITRDQLCELLDDVFGDLPARADLMPVPDIDVLSGKRQIVIDMDVPQSAVSFGTAVLPNDDPDYMAACLVNHIVGGGGITSKLMEEVRLKRGLAYSVFTYLAPLHRISVFRGGVSTRNDTVGQALDVIGSVLGDLADGGISESDLDDAKGHLIGSYPLAFDANAKIASQLLKLRMMGHAADYIDNRNAMIASVTLGDINRVAKRLLNTDNLIVAIVGRPTL
ncbi:MAG: pitrilysin family protein [Hyphomicrobium sp.]